MWSAGTPISSFQMRKASVSAGVVSFPAKTEGNSRSGSRPTHSGLVKNSQAQWMASFLK